MKLARVVVGLVLSATVVSGVATAQESEEEILKFNEKSFFTGEPPVKERLDPDSSVMITRPKIEHIKNMMLEPISAEAKMRMMQTIMQTNPFSLQDMIAMMVAKKKVIPGLSFDEVVESLQSKAFDLNMRPTGHNTPYKILRETYDPDSPRIEILSFFDLVTMRKIIDYSMEFGALLPCRITVAEDDAGQIWLMTLDWDVRWLDTSPNPNRISDDLHERAIRVRTNIEAMMEAAATGDF